MLHCRISTSVTLKGQVKVTQILNGKSYEIAYINLDIT